MLALSPMSKYKIHIDKPLPDAPTVARHRDFDSLYDQYQVTARFAFWRRLYRNPRFFAGLVAVVAVAFLVFEASEPPAAAPVDRAIAGPGWQVVSVSPEGAAFRADSLQLHVPPEAFATPTGLPVQGPVSLHYRWLSGPPAYLAAGLDFGPGPQLTTPQAALGLVEVAAFQDSQRLVLRPGRSLTLTLITPASSGPVTAARWDSSHWELLEALPADTLPPPSSGVSRQLRLSSLGVAGFLETLPAWPAASAQLALPDSLQAQEAWLAWPSPPGLYRLAVTEGSVSLPPPAGQAVVWLLDTQGRWWSRPHTVAPAGWHRLPAPVGQATLWQSLGLPPG